jgi:8-oxo-(d)GTP phosphatase
MKKKTAVRYSPARVARVIMVRLKGNRIYVLLVHSIKRDEWEFPGGKLKRNESYEKGAKREMLEETGMQLLALSPYLVWQHDVVSVDSILTTRTIKRYFKGSGRTKKLRPNGIDVDEVRWFPLADAIALLNTKHETKTILETIGRNSPKKPLSVRHVTHFDPREIKLPEHQE